MKTETKLGFTAFFVIFIPAAIISFSQPTNPSYRKPHIKAPVFVWPEGCPKKDYTKSKDYIPADCIPETNRFILDLKYGLPTPSRGSRVWYRFNDDIYAFSCWNFRKKEYCYIDTTERNVYYR